MNTKKTLLCIVGAFLLNAAVSLWLCAATLHLAHNYTNQATQPHKVTAAHRP